MLESERVPGKCRIRTSTEKLSGRVPERGRISGSTEKRRNSGEKLEKVESVRVSKNYPDDYPKMVESL